MKKILAVMMGMMLVLSFSVVNLYAEDNNGGNEYSSGYVKKKPTDKRGALGAGIILGEPIGPTVKYWLNPRLAIDAGIGFQDDISLYGDILMHEWSLLPQPSKGSLAAYFGVGLRYEDKDRDDEFGIRAVVGADYWIDSQPIEVFLEVAPVFQVSPDTDTNFDAGIGLRYYFMVF